MDSVNNRPAHLDYFGRPCVTSSLALSETERHWRTDSAQSWRIFNAVRRLVEVLGGGGARMWRGGGGGRCTRLMHNRSVGTVDPRILTVPGRSTSGFHQPGRHRVHQARSAVRCSASRVEGDLRHTSRVTACTANNHL